MLSCNESPRLRVVFSGPIKRWQFGIAGNVNYDCINESGTMAAIAVHDRRIRSRDVKETVMPDTQSASDQPPQINATSMFWCFAVVFLVFGGIAFFMYLRVPMVGAPPQTMLWVAAGFGVLAGSCLALALSGVGSTRGIPLKGLDRETKKGNAGTEDGMSSKTQRKAAREWLLENRRSGRPLGHSLPFFHVRFTGPQSGKEPMIYRVFMAKKEFLFVSLYTNTLHPEQTHIPGAGIGGLMGGLVAGFNAHMRMLGIEDIRNHMKALEGVTDESVLRSFVDLDPESFDLNMSQCGEIRVHPPCLVDKAKWPGEIVARIRMKHPELGLLTFDVPSFDDLTKVAEEFPRQFGGEVKMASWESF
jgi:hypothetical protein